ncbi:MAG: hypothetical protein JWQ28_2717 [Pedobacter sp.]|jgi:hypothetical protein|nr:hypothetical protein [Pedobacter sp.]
MKITELIALHLIEAHEGSNWTEVDVRSSLEDVSLKEATMRTKASPNSIASIVQHLTYWNRVMVKRINGIVVADNGSNGFSGPVLHDDEDWSRLKDDNILSAHELANAIMNFNEDALELPILPEHASAYKNLQGSVEHVYYHLGQIVILKQLIRAERLEFNYL